MRTTWNFFTPGQLVWGRGAVGQLGGLLKRRDVEKVMVVTDAVLVEAGVVEPVCSALQAAGISFEVFSGGAS